MDGRRPVVASLRGLVVAGHPAAARAGARLLHAGGNAFDAAVAASAALGVVLPHVCGPAGFGVALCWIAEGKRARMLEFLPRQPGTVGTAPALGGWLELARAHGRKRLLEIFAPAVTLAREGAVLIGGPDAAIADPARAALLEALGAALRGPETGRILRLPDLARTLERAAADGPEILTEGTLGRALAELAGRGDTPAALGPVWADPVQTAWRDLDLLTAAPVAFPGEDEAGSAPLASSPPTAGVLAADAEGNLVALVQSLGGVFGAREVLSGSGLLLGAAAGWGTPPAAHALAPLLALRNGVPVLALAEGIGGRGAAQVLRAWQAGTALPEALASPRPWEGKSAATEAAEVLALERLPHAPGEAAVLLAGVDSRGESDAATA